MTEIDRLARVLCKSISGFCHEDCQIENRECTRVTNVCGPKVKAILNAMASSPPEVVAAVAKEMAAEEGYVWGTDADEDADWITSARTAIAALVKASREI